MEAGRLEGLSLLAVVHHESAEFWANLLPCVTNWIHTLMFADLAVWLFGQIPSLIDLFGKCQVSLLYILLYCTKNSILINEKQLCGG